jgi:hypothetical protein
MTTWTNPDECLSDLVKHLHAWWGAACGSADVPDRADLRPDQMKPLLPCLFIADAEHDPFRVRYRLVGTKAAKVTGFDITGRYLDELLSAEPDQPWMDHYFGLTSTIVQVEQWRESRVALCVEHAGR